MRRIMVGNIILLLVLGLTLITACGGGKTTPTTSSATTTAATSPAATTTAATSTTAATATSPAATTTATNTTQPTTTSAVNKYGGTLKILFFTPPGPNFGYNTEMFAMSQPQTQYALETLIRISQHGVAEPWLATSWEVAPDKKSVTIKLREGVKFHDGTDFNAEAVVWNINRIIASGSAYHVEWSSGEVIDKNTVKLNLKSLTNRLDIGMAQMMITSPAAFAKGEKFANDNPTGTGPFKFVSYAKDTLLKYAKNTEYWQKGLPYLDGIEIRYIIDPMTRKAAFENGEAQVVYEMKDDMRLDLEKKGYMTPAMPAYGGELTVGYVDSNRPESPWYNLKVRQAVSMAINRDALVKARGFGYWIPATQFVLPESPYYIAGIPDSKAMYNVAQARLLLDQAGYPNGFKTKIFSATGFDNNAAVMIQSFLAQVGINAEIDFLDRAAFTQITNQGWRNGIMIRGIIGMPNFGNIMQRFLGPGRPAGGAIFYPKNYLDAIQASIDSPKTDPVLNREVNRLAYENMLAIPIMFTPPGAQPAWIKGLNDMNYYKAFEWWRDTAEIAWLEKK